MKITKIKDHNIFHLASIIVRDYIVKCHPNKPNNDPKASKKECYAIETFLSLSNVVTCIDQLYYSVDMLSGYKSQNTHEKMNRFDYIVFGIENYYLRLTSIYDRCLRLVNIIFQLGIPERECKEATITKNTNVKITPVANALKSLDKFTSPFRFYRNTIAHESTYSEDILNKLGSYYYVAENDQECKKYMHLFKQDMDKFIANKKEEFFKQIDNLEKNVEVLFDAIEQVFAARLNMQNLQKTKEH